MASMQDSEEEDLEVLKEKHENLVN